MVPHAMIAKTLCAHRQWRSELSQPERASGALRSHPGLRMKIANAGANLEGMHFLGSYVMQVVSSRSCCVKVFELCLSNQRNE